MMRFQIKLFLLLKRKLFIFIYFFFITAWTWAPYIMQRFTLQKSKLIKESQRKKCNIFEG